MQIFYKAGWKIAKVLWMSYHKQKNLNLGLTINLWYSDKEESSKMNLQKDKSMEELTS